MTISHITLFKNQITWICNLFSSCLNISELFLDSKAEGDEKSRAPDSLEVCELPDSAVFEILIKLPVKSVLQCRYVCKSWYQLISESYFARVYFKNSPFTVFAITQHEINANTRHKPEEQYFQYVEIGKNGDVILRPLNMNLLTSKKIEAKRTSKNVVCDGLLCLVETPYVESSPFCLVYKTLHNLINPNQSVSIFNPLIGECTTLPKCQTTYNCVRVAYGFGSTIDGDYYKVVRIAREFYGCVLEAQILTIGVDEKWRELDIYNLPLFVFSHGVTMNGVLHFVGSNDYNLESNGIMYAFDIANEKGHCFALPCAVRYRHFISRIFLSVWNGHLCISDCSNELQIDLWTMEQYGVVDSWRKDTILRKINFRNLFIPITTMRNGDLLVSDTNQLRSFVQKTKNLVQVKGHDRTRLPFFLAGCAYTPCFLSPRDIVTRKKLQKKEHKRSANEGISHINGFSSRDIFRDVHKYDYSIIMEEARQLGVDVNLVSQILQSQLGINVYMMD